MSHLNLGGQRVAAELEPDLVVTLKHRMQDRQEPRGRRRNEAAPQHPVKTEAEVALEPRSSQPGSKPCGSRESGEPCPLAWCPPKLGLTLLFLGEHL